MTVFLKIKEAISSQARSAALRARELGGRTSTPRPAAAVRPSSRRRRGARRGHGLGLGLLRRGLGGRRERVELRPRALDRLDRLLRRDRGRLEVSDSGLSGAWSFATNASQDFLSRISPTGTPSIAVSARPMARRAGESCSAALTRATPVLRSKDSSMPSGPWKIRSIAGPGGRASSVCLPKKSGAGRLRAARASTGLTAARRYSRRP